MTFNQKAKNYDAEAELNRSRTRNTEPAAPAARPDYTRYFENFKLAYEVRFQLLEEAETKGERKSKLDQLIEEAKKENYPKRAEKAIIRRIKRIAKRLEDN